MSRLREIIHEIHRRSLWQVLGIYLGSSWLVFEVVQTLTEGVGLPEWVPSSALVALLIGLPIVMATAFVQEGMGTRPEAASLQPEPSSEDTGTTDYSSTSGAGDARVRHRLFTWRNALLGGVAAFALLGLVTAGYVAMRTLGIGPAGTLVAKGVLDERARILIADFESPAAEEELARTATETFRIDFGQSQVVNVVQPTEVTSVLERMGRSRDARLGEELARETAIREGIPAIVTGEVNSAGGGYVLSAQLVRASTGEVLVPARETAKDSSQIIDAIDRLSGRMRERIGESLRSLQREEPLAQVTTGSLDALRLYSQALAALDRESDEDRAIALLEEALERDSAFAMAWRKLGVILGNRFGEQRARQVEALTRAYRHKDRLTKRERYLAEAAYYTNVLDDQNRAITAYRNLLDLNPDDTYALNNLGIVYAFLRDRERAVEQFRLAIETDSASSLSYWNMLAYLYSLGRTDEARAVLERFRTRLPDNPSADEFAARLAASGGDYAEAEAHLASLRQRTSGSAFWRWRTSWDLWAMDVVRGRLSEARDHMRDAMEAQRERGLPGQYVANAVDLASAELRATGRPGPSLKRVDEALSRYPLDDVEPLNRPYTTLAAFYAEAGRPERARRLLEAYREAVPEELRDWLERTLLDEAEGELALAEGRAEEALEAFRRSDVGFCTICALPDIARAHEALSRPDSAIAYYRRYVEEPWCCRARFYDPWYKATSLERLGQLYDEAGDLEKAALYYAKFVELWKDADPELQPRVQAAQERLEEIVAERG